MSIRVGIDWDNNGFICYNAKPGDPLNIISNAVHWYGIDRTFTGTASLVQDDYFWPSDDGLQAIQFKFGTNSTPGANGLAFGRTGGTYNFPVTGNTEYTFTALVKGIANFSGINFVLQAHTDHEPAVFWSSNLSELSSTEWTRFTGTFTTSGPATKMALRFVKNTTSASDSEVAFTGAMIVQGDTLPGFNTGDSISLYENMTDYVLSCQWSGGYNKWSDSIFAEGTAGIKLDNQTRIFSPEYTSSPLFGSIKQKILVTLDYIETIVYPLWRGWVTKYNLTTGLSSSQQCDISCEQGRFRLDEFTYVSPLVGEVTADQLIQDIIEQSHVSTYAPCQVVIGTSKIGQCWFGYDGTPGADDRFKVFNLDTGLTPYTVVGDTWGANTSATKALQAILDVEHGWLAIKRNGQMRFINRHAFDDQTATAINLDTDAINSRYVYGDSFFNNIRLTYSPKSTRTGKIWETREDVTLKPKETDVKITAQLEYEEGSKITVLSVQDWSGSSTYTATLYNGTKDFTDFVDVDVELSNGQITLTANNNSRRKLSLSITLYGDISESYGNLVYLLSDETQEAAGAYEMKISSDLLRDETQADDLAQYLLHIYSRQSGDILSFELKDKNATWRTNMLTWEFGTFLALTESQTSHTGNYIIIGESGNWQPGVLSFDYTLYPFNRLNAGVVMGTSTIGGTAKVSY